MQCGGLLCPGNKGYEKGSGFYALQVRVSPGPDLVGGGDKGGREGGGVGEVAGLGYCYLVSWGRTEWADWDLPNFS